MYDFWSKFTLEKDNYYRVFLHDVKELNKEKLKVEKNFVFLKVFSQRVTT